MKTKAILWILLLPVGLLGCGRQPEPRHIVILPDVSGSIQRESLEQAFKAIDQMVRQLQRGDRIAVIPILGDAQAEASGQIIRFEVPKERRAYDADLRDFRHKLANALAEMQVNSVTHPGSKTDILGTIELAKQEFQLATEQPKRLLIILSDFIQEDRDFDFRTDGRLQNRNSAKAFADEITKRRCSHFDGVSVFLGLLRSDEYANLKARRRDAIEEFWRESFKVGNSQPKFFIDGLGFLASSQEEP